MRNKNKIGALVILGGIALLGYVYFKKTKPTVAKSQSEGLKNLSNFYKSGAGGQEDTKIDVSYVAPTAGNFVLGGVSQSMLTNLDYTKLTPKESEDLKVAIDRVCPSCATLGNIGMPTLSQQTVYDLQNMQTGLAGIDFSNLKF